MKILLLTAMNLLNLNHWFLLSLFSFNVFSYQRWLKSNWNRIEMIDKIVLIVIQNLRIRLVCWENVVNQQMILQSYSLFILWEYHVGQSNLEREMLLTFNELIKINQRSKWSSSFSIWREKKHRIRKYLSLEISFRNERQNWLLLIIGFSRSEIPNEIWKVDFFVFKQFQSS